jgi:hypothetical protein
MEFAAINWINCTYIIVIYLVIVKHHSRVGRMAIQGQMGCGECEKRQRFFALPSFFPDWGFWRPGGYNRSMMIYQHTFSGLTVATGDILCTQDGVEGSLFGQLWRLVGRIVPGEVDHCLVYVGPGGRCIESGARGVIEFEMPGSEWDAETVWKERLLLDTLFGVVYPLENRGLTEAEEQRLRLGVVAFCREQVAQGKPYNLNVFNPETDGAFYCSQLIYKAYLEQGIDLNPEESLLNGPLTGKIIFPTDLWQNLPHRRVNAGE